MYVYHIQNKMEKCEKYPRICYVTLQERPEIPNAREYLPPLCSRNSTFCVFLFGAGVFAPAISVKQVRVFLALS